MLILHRRIKGEYRMASFLRSADLKCEIEAKLGSRIPSALSPQPPHAPQLVTSGIIQIDALLRGGLPLGTITEVVGAECSGSISLALSFVAEITRAGKVCAWIDVSDCLHPESAVGAGIDPKRLLWVRCGVQANYITQPQDRSFKLSEKYLTPRPAKKGLHGGGFGRHPRGEVKGLSAEVGGLLHSAEAINPRCAEPIKKPRSERRIFEAPTSLPFKNRPMVVSGKPWGSIEQALKVADLILQGGGFSAIVLDMGSLAPEYISRVPLATWFRYRAAAEKSQASIVLLTQHPSAKSSAGLVLRMRSNNDLSTDRTVFTVVRHTVEVARQRFPQAPSYIIPLRKPPQRANAASWQTRTSWAGRS
jgi:recombination protein RecA